MPVYYFHLRSTDTIKDVDGTELADDEAARAHADVVAHELMFGSEGMLGQDWSQWSIAVHDEVGEELFSFPFSEIESQHGGGTSSNAS